jgi:hypothetical protein
MFEKNRRKGILARVASTLEQLLTSNIIALLLFSSLDKPLCKPDQVQVYGVAKRERVRVPCDVIANPSSDLRFEWVFNSSAERLDLQESLVDVRGTRSIATHTPQVNKYRIHHILEFAVCGWKASLTGLPGSLRCEV